MILVAYICNSVHLFRPIFFMKFFIQASLERGWKMGREFCIVTGFILTVLGGCLENCQAQIQSSKSEHKGLGHRLGVTTNNVII